MHHPAMCEQRLIDARDQWRLVCIVQNECEATVCEIAYGYNGDDQANVFEHTVH